MCSATEAARGQSQSSSPLFCISQSHSTSPLTIAVTSTQVASAQPAIHGRPLTGPLQGHLTDDVIPSKARDLLFSRQCKKESLRRTGNWLAAGGGEAALRLRIRIGESGQTAFASE